MENSYWERTDSFERKMRLVKAAWAKKDFRLARALLASMRVTAQQAAARPGEAGDSAIPKKAIWEALRDCKDEQLYNSDLSVVDLGLVYDVRVRAETVYLVMAMPNRGRPRLMRNPGVRKVVFEQTWEPGWSSNRLTEEGRRKLGV